MTKIIYCDLNAYTYKFIPFDQQLINQGNYEDKVSLYIYVKERIDWVWEKRPKGKERDWTKEDAKKYGDLIVVRIKVIYPPKEGY